VQAHRRTVRLGQKHQRPRRADAAWRQALGFKFTLTMAAYDLIRLPKLLGAQARECFIAHKVPNRKPQDILEYHLLSLFFSTSG
jgi:hypothetical protein